MLPGCKRCTGCGETKPLEEFWRRERGYRKSRCRTCEAAAEGGGQILAAREEAARGVRTCTGCGEQKPLDEFGRTKKNQAGRLARCKACQSAYAKAYYHDSKNKARVDDYSKAWAKRNRPRINAQRRARRTDPEYARREREKDRAKHPDNWIKQNYKLSRDQWDALLASQGGGCAICGRTDPGGIGKRNGFHVDHDHGCCPGRKSCGKCVRGLLCNSCNPMLGASNDDPSVLRAGADYLERWNGVTQLDHQSPTGDKTDP